MGNQKRGDKLFLERRFKKKIRYGVYYTPYLIRGRGDRI